MDRNNIGVPCYGPGTTGDEAVLAMVADLFADRRDGSTRTITLAYHHLDGGAVVEQITVGWGRIDGLRTLRYVGERGKPNGAGSSSVFCSGDKRNDDPAAIAVRLGMVAASRAAKHPNGKGGSSSKPWVFYLAQFQDNEAVGLASVPAFTESGLVGRSQ